MKLNIKKMMLVAGAASTVTLASVAGAGVVHAATNSSADQQDPMSSLVDKITSKFNLNKNDVQAVFDQQHSEMEAKHQQKLEDRLNQDVTDKKITAEQKDKILAKLKELQAEREANKDDWKNKTAEERWKAMDAKRTELEKWAKENSIPMEYLHMGGPGGPHGHDGPRDR